MMKMKSAALVALLLLVVASGAANADTVIIPVASESDVWRVGFGNSRAGAIASMQGSLFGIIDLASSGYAVFDIIGQWMVEEYRYAVEFSLASLSPGAVISQAEFGVRDYGRGGSNLLTGYVGNGVSEVGDGGNLGPTIVNPAFSASNSFAYYDVTSFVRTLFTNGDDFVGLNLSWETSQIPGLGARWSNWDTGANAPKLRITYSTDSGSTVPLPSAAWAGLGLLGVIGAVRRYRRRSAA